MQRAITLRCTSNTEFYSAVTLLCRNLVRTRYPINESSSAVWIGLKSWAKSYGEGDAVCAAAGPSSESTSDAGAAVMRATSMRAAPIHSMAMTIPAKTSTR